MKDLYKSQISSETEAKSLLRSYGISLTKQRLLIAQYLFSKHQHVSAESLHHELCQSGNQISKATVYNTLGLFVKKDLLHEVIIDGYQRYFDSNLTSHHHIYNMDTEDLIDLTCSEHLFDHFKQHHLPEKTELEAIDIVIKVKNKSN